MQTILFGTNNTHKLEEIRAMVPPGFHVLGLSDLGISLDVDETDSTLEGNALLKARGYAEASGMPCFADDTGLEVAALNGEPGVYSARWAGPACSYQDNVDKMLREMEGKTDRRAVFRTVIAWVDGQQEPRFFEGRVEGIITPEARGQGGFGYDPVFLPEEHSLTFAEMPAAEKHALSHRGRAVRAFVEFLASQPA